MQRIPRRCYSSKQLILRSLLFIPGNSQKMLSKLFSIQNVTSILSITIFFKKPDAFVPDLEDSVANDHKLEARKMVAEFLKQEWCKYAKQQQEQKMLLIPRVNNVPELLADDVDALVAAATTSIDALTLGKVSTPEEMQQVDALLTQAENKYNLPQHSIKLIPTIETALGLVHAYHICSTVPLRTVAVAFGADDCMYFYYIVTVL